MIYLLVAVGYLAASSMVLSVLVTYSETQYSWLPSSTKHHLIATTVGIFTYLGKGTFKYYVSKVSLILPPPPASALSAGALTLARATFYILN